jgi:predicted ArsR family transcriptional regulator
MLQRQLTGSPAGEVLTLLQRRGAATIKDLEDALGVTATAVRQQITSLMADGFIAQEIERAARGRPRHVYSLTAKGRALFPHYYDEFTNSLLREILITEGPEKVQSLLGRMSQRLAAQYERQLAGLPAAERAAKLTELLNAKGILAEIRFEPDGIVFHEYSCP